MFVVYLFTRQSNVAAALTTLVDALGYGPTFVRGWSQPKKDSVASFALNGIKFVPSLMAMDPLSFATDFTRRRSSCSTPRSRLCWSCAGARSVRSAGQSGRSVV